MNSDSPAPETEKSIGILMADTSFDRLVGDIGNRATWPFPVHYHVVRHATPATMVDLEASNVLGDFLIAADQLMELGVMGITTTCGFLGLYQQTLADHCSVPVATSSLLQVAMVERMLPAHQRVGILTYNQLALTDKHLSAVGAATDTPMTGMAEDSVFYQWIMQGKKDINIRVLEREVVKSAERLVREYPEVGAIVSECTNLTPFSAAVQRATNRPVYDMVSLVHWFHQGLKPLRFEQPR